MNTPPPLPPHPAAPLAFIRRTVLFKGTSRFLKENIKEIKCFAADPPGASMFSYYTKVRCCHACERIRFACDSVAVIRVYQCAYEVRVLVRDYDMSVACLVRFACNYERAMLLVLLIPI